MICLGRGLFPLLRVDSQLFVLLHLIAPKPRSIFSSEKTYVTSQSTTSKPTSPRQLPSWYDRWLAERQAREQEAEAAETQEEQPPSDPGSIEPAEVYLSVVFPAYNEEKRIVPTLEEAVAWLDKNIGRAGGPQVSGNRGNRRHQARHAKDGKAVGYEILIVNDGSTDRTVDVVLDFCRENKLHDVLRVVSLEKNRGKGGGVTHGFRHVRGEYVLFADADGASKFSDVSKLIEGCEEVVDGSHRGVAIGSRAHLVGSEAVVKVHRAISSLSDNRCSSPFVTEC